MSELLPSYLDGTKLALAGFLARYREPTAGSYRVDLRCDWRWCTDVDVDPLRITRAQLELFVRATTTDHPDGDDARPECRK
jgi:hypothetical protein